MRIENRRDFFLTMDRVTRQAKTDARSYTKHYTGSSASLVDSLNNKPVSGENHTANALSMSLKKSNYNDVKNTSKELREKAQQLLKNKEDREEAVQGVFQFTEMYNQLLKEMNRINTDTMNRYGGELKEYTAKYREKFQNMGIEQRTDGTLQADPLKIGDADLESWYDFLEKASKVAEKVQADAESNLFILGRNQTIYGTNYNRYGQENI